MYFNYKYFSYNFSKIKLKKIKKFKKLLLIILNINKNDIVFFSKKFYINNISNITFIYIVESF